MPVGAGMNRPARAGLAVFIAWNPRRGELLMNAAPLALKKLHAAKRPQAVAWDDHAKCQECRGVPTRFCLSIAYKRAMSQSHTEPERTPETRSSPTTNGKSRVTASIWQLSMILLALGFTLATGPFRAPDEYHHFFRAYQISEGRLVAK